MSVIFLREWKSRDSNALEPIHIGLFNKDELLRELTMWEQDVIDGLAIDHCYSEFVGMIVSGTAERNPEGCLLGELMRELTAVGESVIIWSQMGCYEPCTMSLNRYTFADFISESKNIAYYDGVHLISNDQMLRWCDCLRYLAL